MDLARPVEPEKLLTLQEAADKLAVSVDVLLYWNQCNILKPTIMPTGQVGYPLEQINQFLGIHKINPSANPPLVNQMPVARAEHNPTEINHFQKDYSDLHTRLKSPDFTRARHEYFSIGPALATTTLGIALVIILVTQPATIKSLLNEAGNMGSALTSQISQLNVSSFTTSPVQLKNSVASDKDLNNEGQAVLQTKLTMLDAIFGKKPTKTTTTVNGKVSTALLGASTQTTQVSGFASSTTPANSGNTTGNSVFDSHGNIKGKTTNTDLLATTLGINGMIQNDSSIKQVVNLNIPLAILTLSLMSLLFVFRKRLAYSSKKPAALGIDPHNFIDDTNAEKILEVNQKTDGTVVVSFQGKEYKICKPELDSESDQFIERLMGLITPNAKEIDYDTFNDGEIRLSAPLSKLVTRLGFVGIKRDLFFPRTSKNRVLFRRYLTENDLVSMHLTTEQITNEFLSFSQS